MGCDEKKTQSFKIENRMCKLCHEEKLMINLYPEQHILLNERSEIDMM